MAKKNRVVLCLTGGRYRVEKVLNLLEPRVGSFLDSKKVQELIDDKNVEVEIKAVRLN